MSATSPVVYDARSKEYPSIVALADRSTSSTHQKEPKVSVLLNWLLRVGPNVIPIPGASRVTSILDSVKAVEFELDDEDFAKVGVLA